MWKLNHRSICLPITETAWNINLIKKLPYKYSRIIGTAIAAGETNMKLLFETLSQDRSYDFNSENDLSTMMNSELKIIITYRNN